MNHIEREMIEKKINKAERVFSDIDIEEKYYECGYINSDKRNEEYIKLRDDFCMRFTDNIKNEIFDEIEKNDKYKNKMFRYEMFTYIKESFCNIYERIEKEKLEKIREEEIRVFKIEEEKRRLEKIKKEKLLYKTEAERIVGRSKEMYKNCGNRYIISLNEVLEKLDNKNEIIDVIDNLMTYVFNKSRSEIGKDAMDEVESVLDNAIENILI